jgi:cephalosporin hydroxylase
MKTIKEIFRSHAVFDSEGRHTNGTDKESNHSYGNAYESIFFMNRRDVQLMMEIGVADGASLLAWREVFPNATIVGLDIHVSEKAIANGIEFHKGDQRIQDDCQRAAAGRQFDVIVEDAMHTLDNTLLTLFWLWPFVKPGGLYIVEEWANIGGCKQNVQHLFPNAEIVNTTGPSGGIEPLIVFRKQ